MKKKQTKHVEYYLFKLAPDPITDEQKEAFKDNISKLFGQDYFELAKRADELFMYLDMHSFSSYEYEKCYIKFTEKLIFDWTIFDFIKNFERPLLFDKVWYNEQNKKGSKFKIYKHEERLYYRFDDGVPCNLEEYDPVIMGLNLSERMKLRPECSEEFHRTYQIVEIGSEEWKYKMRLK